MLDCVYIITYEELYSALSQYSQVNLTFGENESEAIAKGISETFSTAINEGISDTTGTNSGSNRNVTRSHNHGSSFNFFSVGHNSGSGKATTTGTFEGENQSHRGRSLHEPISSLILLPTRRFTLS